MQQPLISVIVPIYKVEDYLDKCVESILTQTYKNLEVWLVDDGSPDRCGQICDEWAEKDARIKVLHKNNGGLADARNYAIDRATGKYLCFIDSDDFVASRFIETLYFMIVQNGADMSVVNFETFHTGDNVVEDTKEYPHLVLDNISALETMFYQDLFDNMAWGKLYDRRLFENIRYPLDCVIEDCPVTYRLIDKCQKVALSQAKLYYYLLRDDSIEGAPFSSSKMDSALMVFEYFNRNTGITQKVPSALKCRLVSLALHFYLKMPANYHREHYIVDIIRANRLSVLFDNKARQKTRIACLLSYLGMSTVAYCFRYVNKRK